ncbi:hypothetical protein BWQ96_03098 [Gracilariopsis chorda]|uniref:Uncharacterized protein n=1 Tax=Gracilariopsis chorda TaxID=448386 RepID=A0A2V3IYC2_9FLOR|nr:hypothetical protein BWQ96_03098 [Gracilariopsis chorda]|eukprot:PXF47156.1 hypothetical protein BWQ96_03098 [Gracilariopsis chorda]
MSFLSHHYPRKTNDGDDYLDTAVSFMSLFLAHQQHTSQMLAAAQSAALALLYPGAHVAEIRDEEELRTKPGRSNNLFSKKATYVLREQSNFYKKLRYHDENKYLFKKTNHLTISEFDALHEVVAQELSRTLTYGIALKKAIMSQERGN